MIIFRARLPKRTKTNNLDQIELDNGLSLLKFIRSNATRDDDVEIYNRIPPAKRSIEFETIPHFPNSSLNPPWHIHFNQYENFKVIKGSARFYLITHCDTPFKAKIESKIIKKDETITILPGQIHTFRNSSFDENLEIKFNLKPSFSSVKTSTENFFRNTQSYRSDCSSQRMERSIWQVCLFNDFGQIGLVPQWLIRWPTVAYYTANIVGKFMNIIMGKWIGQNLMGLQKEYEEYSISSSSSRMTNKMK